MQAGILTLPEDINEYYKYASFSGPTADGIHDLTLAQALQQLSHLSFLSLLLGVCINLKTSSSVESSSLRSIPHDRNQ